jgi:hypothetical protein
MNILILTPILTLILTLIIGLCLCVGYMMIMHQIENSICNNKNLILQKASFSTLNIIILIVIVELVCALILLTIKIIEHIKQNKKENSTYTLNNNA